MSEHIVHGRLWRFSPAVRIKDTGRFKPKDQYPVTLEFASLPRIRFGPVGKLLAEKNHDYRISQQLTTSANDSLQLRGRANDIHRASEGHR